MKVKSVWTRIFLFLVLCFLPFCGGSPRGDRTCSGDLVSEDESFMGSITDEKSCFYNASTETPWAFSN